MSTRVQVILDEEERELFRRQAKAEGLSLSAWLRKAARAKLSGAERADDLRSRSDLRAFFASCDAGEPGREPDWDEHLEVIRRSTARGSSGT